MFYVVFISAVGILLYNVFGMIRHKASMHKASKSKQQEMFKAQKQDFENIELRK